MAGWRARIATLWRVHPSIEDSSGQRRARLAAGLFVALAMVCLVTLLFPAPPGSSASVDPKWLTVAALAGIAAGYFLVRSGRLDAGILLALVAVVGVLWASRVSAADHETGQLSLPFLVVPILLAGILLPTRFAALFSVITIVLAWGLEALEDRRFGASLDTEDLTLGLLLTAAAVISVTASSLAERDARRLNDSEQVLRQVAENIPEVFFVVAADFSRMRYTSPAYQTVLGRTVEQAMADPFDWLKAVHPDDLPRVQAGLAKNEPLLEFRALLPSGEIKQIRARTFPVLGTDGKPVSIVGIAEDVTEARRAQELLREAQRQRIHLLQQLAHDLASPLSPVKIQLRLLKQRMAPEAQNSLAIVQRNVEHVERLVADVRDVARLEGGELKIDRQDVDLAALAREAVETLASSAEDRQVRVAIGSPMALSVQADPGRLLQVLYNLIGNALKFTPPGGVVNITIAREAGEARVDVGDSGSGMRPDQLAGLFKPFSQVHDKGVITKVADRGTGLGLFISKGLVEAHGGRIEARSPGPGLGSTFTFWIPVAKPADGPV